MRWWILGLGVTLLLACARVPKVHAVVAAQGEMRGGSGAPDDHHAAEALSRDASDREELSRWEWRREDRLARQEEALARYRAAEISWRSIVEQGVKGRDATAPQLKLADARCRIIALSVATGASTSPKEIAEARDAARRARDALFGERRRTAARLLVDLADQLLLGAELDFERTQGARGVPHRNELHFDGAGDARRVVRDPLPQLVEDAIRARDEYVEHIAATEDRGSARHEYAVEAALPFYWYGHLEEARARLEPVYATECGRSMSGFKAWGYLVGIAVWRRDMTASRKLSAESPSCAIDPETRIREIRTKRPVLQSLFVNDARRMLRDATGLPEGPERRRQIRDAAAAFRQWIDEAPGRGESPEAAITGARAYEEVGEPARAIELYELFIYRYAMESVLAELEKGSSQAPPDLKGYTERVEGLVVAYGALAALHAAASDYRDAALTYLAESSSERLPPEVRLGAARRAIELFARRGVPGSLRALGAMLAELGAPLGEQRNVEDLAQRAEAALQRTTAP